jgi:hypothetical protein
MTGTWACRDKRCEFQAKEQGLIAMREVHKRYMRELFSGMAAYVGLIIVYSVLVPGTESTSLRTLLAVLPMLPLLFVIRALVRVVRDQDELERRIDLEAIAISALITGFGFFSYGLLLSAGVGWKIPSDGLAMCVMPCLFFTFGIAKFMVIWRYRSHE